LGASAERNTRRLSYSKQAYQIALFLGEISKPDSSYRKVLETIKVKGAYTIQQKGGEQAATIVQIKHY